MAETFPQAAEINTNDAQRNLIAQRQAFENALVHGGLISEDFRQSGALEMFSLDENLGRDALPHILIGDEYGGAHHLPTIMALGAESTQVASMVLSANNPKKNRAYYRGEQKVRENGVFEAKRVRITGEDGEVIEKQSGSIFFPNEWTTQELLEAIIATSVGPGVHNPDSHAYTHQADVQGVRMIVNTDDMTGKIVAARPLKKLP